MIYNKDKRSLIGVREVIICKGRKFLVAIAIYFRLQIISQLSQHLGL